MNTELVCQFWHSHALGVKSWEFRQDNRIWLNINLLIPCTTVWHDLVYGAARCNLRPLHTRDWEPVTIALQALSLVEKVEPVQVRYFTPAIGEILGITGWDPSVCKSNRLHVDILRCSFTRFGVYSINSFKLIGNFPAVLSFNRLFLKLNRFICSRLPVLPDHSFTLRLRDQQITWM